MNKLTDLNHLKSFLKSSGLRPKHYMGQNFLVDEDVLSEIIKASDLKKTDTVLEVGPGLGILTQELVKHAGKVIAVEKDERMVGILGRVFNVERSGSPPGTGGVRGGRGKANNLPPLTPPILGGEELQPNASNLDLINQDILRFHLDQYIQGPYKVVANIPYYLTSVLFRYFLEQKNKPRLLVLMVQKEVAERITAKVGHLSILGISVQTFADAEIMAIVPKTSFWPIPKVDSAIIKITPKDKFPEIKDKKLFFSIIKSAFAGKRKQLKNTIKNMEALKKAGIDPKARPQDLSIEQWLDLYLNL